MSQVVSQGNGLGQIFIKVQRARYGSGDLGNLQCMSETRNVVVTERCYENLGFVLQPPEGIAMDNPVPIALKFGTHGTGIFRSQPPLGQLALHGTRRQRFFLLL